MSGGRGRAEGEGVGVVLKGSSGIPVVMGMSPLMTGGRATETRTSEKLRGLTRASRTGNLRVSGTTLQRLFWL